MEAIVFQGGGIVTNTRCVGSNVGPWEFQLSIKARPKKPTPDGKPSGVLSLRDKRNC